MVLMLTDPQVTRYLARIRKALRTTSVLGSMLLWLELDTMPAEDRAQILAACELHGIRSFDR